jgi:hypothetical protein
MRPGASPGNLARKGGRRNRLWREKDTMLKDTTLKATNAGTITSKDTIGADTIAEDKEE